MKLYNDDCLTILDELTRSNFDFNKAIFVSEPPKECDSNKSEEDYFTLLEAIFDEWKQVIILEPEQLYKHSFNIGRFPETIISWVYDNKNTSKQHKDIAFFGVKPKIKKNWWNINQVENDFNQTPIEVMSNIIEILPKGYTIIDPFMGTGSTGIACKIHNRDFIGIEINEKYYNVAVKRIEEYFV